MAEMLQPILDHELTVVAADVTFEAYVETHAELGREWIDGVVVQSTPVGLRHEELRDYLRELMHAYFAFNPIGRVLGEPFVMTLAEKQRGREPDLFLILNGNPGTLHDTFMEGPADLVIEIISPGTQRTDRGEKFDEYQSGGVREYWILDPAVHDRLFYRRNDDGLYIRCNEDADGVYTTPLLPKFELHVPTLWTAPLPNTLQIVEAVRKVWEG